MTTLSLQDIGLPRAKQQAAKKKAKQAGKSVAEYLRSLVERDLMFDKTFDEILRPVREDFKKSGVTESQLDEIVEQARESIWRRSHKSRRPRP